MRLATVKKPRISKKKTLESENLELCIYVDIFFKHGSSSGCVHATMFSKRAKGYEASNVPPAKRFRHNLADAFLSNDITGARAQEMFNDAQAAGAADVEDLASHSSCPSNAART